MTGTTDWRSSRAFEAPKREAREGGCESTSRPNPSPLQRCSPVGSGSRPTTGKTPFHPAGGDTRVAVESQSGARPVVTAGQSRCHIWRTESMCDRRDFGRWFHTECIVAESSGIQAYPPWACKCGPTRRTWIPRHSVENAESGSASPCRPAIGPAQGGTDACRQKREAVLRSPSGKSSVDIPCLQYRRESVHV